MIEAMMGFAMLVFVLMLFAVPVAVFIGVILLITVGTGAAVYHDRAKEDPRLNKPW